MKGSGAAVADILLGRRRLSIIGTVWRRREPVELGAQLDAIRDDLTGVIDRLLTVDAKLDEILRRLDEEEEDDSGSDRF